MPWRTTTVRMGGRVGETALVGVAEAALVGVAEGAGATLRAALVAAAAAAVTCADKRAAVEAARVTSGNWWNMRFRQYSDKIHGYT